VKTARALVRTQDRAVVAVNKQQYVTLLDRKLLCSVSIAAKYTPGGIGLGLHGLAFLARLALPLWRRFAAQKK
jgi:hypothetical protein